VFLKDRLPCQPGSKKGDGALLAVLVLPDTERPPPGANEIVLIQKDQLRKAELLKDLLSWLHHLADR